MRVEQMDIAGPIVLVPEVRRDDRGFFVETSRASELEAAGIDVDFVQENHSRSVRDTLRGLHFQRPPGQAKLVRVVRGEIFDVIVDLRPGSATLGRHATINLDDRAHRQLFIPAGFAHGFCVLSDEADVIYRVSRYYDADLEQGIAWDDPDLNIRWPNRDHILSARDRANPSFAEVRRSLEHPH